eukprot:TRINITY_DN1957_c0_g1_i1.p1 TRINITY_DN1957_c0_g1~~TRINITY_DN1957_c0_g1_i1.p1  ORF type:complete len:484 (+),score=99.38 TRINITY_DN1957_c0_g1_i1:118-1569(+)
MQRTVCLVLIVLLGLVWVAESRGHGYNSYRSLSDFELMEDNSAGKNGTEEHHRTIWEVGMWATIYSGCSSAGFILAVCITYIGLNITTAGHRAIGNFGRFMVMVECIDAIPEAAVLADATEKDTITWSFVLSIFFLNLANTLASSIDIQATKTSHGLHKILMVSIFIAVGMLSYTIPSQVYNNFARQWHDHERGIMDIAALFIGTIIGAFLIVILLYLDGLAHSSSNAPKSLPQLKESAEQFKEAYAGMSQAIEEALNENNNEDPSLARAQSFVGSIRSYGSGASNKRLSDTQSPVLKRYKSSLRLTPDEINKYMGQRNQKIKDNVDKLSKVIEIIESLEHLEENIGSEGEAIVEDTAQIIQDIYLDEAIPMEAQTQSIHIRALKLLGTMFLIGIWAALLTFSLSLFFYWLSSANHNLVGWVDAFSEGLSGGAFLATIAGTMMPRIQQDAYRTGWSKDKSKIIGLLSFELGLLGVVLMEMILS